ncbi:MAG: metallophosphoesterase family protein [Solirubrobacterales bacterium]|nr:metallophosphoesterase family protein [Solirubrobacterales bacterium]
MSPLTAVLYDIHGNLAALEAVLGDARAAGAEQFVLGGDYALFGPFPAETVELLRGLENATWIRGNVDRWSAHPEEAPDNEVIQLAIPACRAALGSKVIEELEALPFDVVLEGTRYCHASPVSDVRSFAPEPQEEDQELLGESAERRVVFGHTHVAFRRVGPDGVELVNPGSVGLPWDGDHRASYALIRGGNELEHRRVAYEHEAAATALRERFGVTPWTETVVRRINTARF